jgi:hypothetical protein
VLSDILINPKERRNKVGYTGLGVDVGALLLLYFTYLSLLLHYSIELVNSFLFLSLLHALCQLHHLYNFKKENDSA